MAIFLVQHGLSLSKDRDPEKGLSPDGEAQTAKIADVAKFYKIPVAGICHSGKKRAVQTAEIMKSVLGINTPLQEVPGIRPLDDVRIFGDRIDPGANTMVVGHLPHLERLVSYLTTGAAEKRVYRFQNSGIVSLACEKGDWYIKWTLNPTID